MVASSVSISRGGPLGAEPTGFAAHAASFALPADDVTDETVGAVGRGLIAQQHVGDIPALATAAGRGRLLHLVAAVSCRDAISINQPLPWLSAVRHQELHFRLRCVAAIDHVALSICRNAGEAETNRDSSDG